MNCAALEVEIALRCAGHLSTARWLRSSAAQMRCAGNSACKHCYFEKLCSIVRVDEVMCLCVSGRAGPGSGLSASGRAGPRA